MSAASRLSFQQKNLVNARKTLIEKASGEDGFDRLAGLVNEIAYTEGQIEVFTRIAALEEKGVPQARISNVLVDILANYPKDDSSGRKGDARRSFHDGEREAARMLRLDSDEV